MLAPTVKLCKLVTTAILQHFCSGKSALRPFLSVDLSNMPNFTFHASRRHSSVHIRLSCITDGAHLGPALSHVTVCAMCVSLPAIPAFWQFQSFTALLFSATIMHALALRDLSPQSCSGQNRSWSELACLDWLKTSTSSLAETVALQHSDAVKGCFIILGSCLSAARVLWACRFHPDCE